MLMAGGRYIGISGPVEPLSVESVRQALVEIARAGTHTRIGLRPNRSTNKWDFDPKLRPDAVREIPGAANLAELAAAVESVRRETGEKPPIQVILCGNYVLIDTNHGLADGKLYMDLIGAISSYTSTGTLPDWTSTPETRHALAKATFRWFVARPKHLRQLVRARSVLHELGSPVDSPVDSEVRPWQPSYAVSFAISSDAVESELKQWRKRNAPNVSGALMAMVLVRRAFQSVGLDASDDVILAVDCRRYLPKTSVVNGNFVLGMSVPLQSTTPIGDAAVALATAYESGLPLAWLGFASTISRVRRSAVTATGETAPTHPRMRLMYSDLGRPPQIGASNFIADEGRMLTGLLDPAGPEALTIMAGVVGNERTFSASFHDNVFPRDKIEAALRLATTDPIALLTDEHRS